jgi:hypothetical protein
VAESGTDAAEGDEGRSAVSSPRATGWRVPSVQRTQSGLPADWQDVGPGPLAPIVALPFPTEIDERNTDGETVTRTESATTTTRRRRRSFRRKRTEPAPADIDLVALGAADDQAWTDLALAELEEPATADAEAAMPGIDAPDSVPGTGDDPWSVLADDLAERDPHHFTESATGGSEPTGLELEQEFWA